MTAFLGSGLLDPATEAMLLALPKVSLHDHLIGAVSAPTVLAVLHRETVLSPPGHPGVPYRPGSTTPRRRT